MILQIEIESGVGWVFNFLKKDRKMFDKIKKLFSRKSHTEKRNLKAVWDDKEWRVAHYNSEEKKIMLGEL